MPVAHAKLIATAPHRWWSVRVWDEGETAEDAERLFAERKPYAFGTIFEEVSPGVGRFELWVGKPTGEQAGAVRALWERMGFGSMLRECGHNVRTYRTR